MVVVLANLVPRECSSVLEPAGLFTRDAEAPKRSQISSGEGWVAVPGEMWMSLRVMKGKNRTEQNEKNGQAYLWVPPNIHPCST